MLSVFAVDLQSTMSEMKVMVRPVSIVASEKQYRIVKERAREMPMEAQHAGKETYASTGLTIR